LDAYTGWYRAEGGTKKHMKCPYCGQLNSRVVDSRPAEDGSFIRRRRSCDECGKRFTTYEKVETIPLIVIKKDQNREEYDRQKIEMGILRACYKRPVSAEQIKKATDEIETEIFNREEKEISSSSIGEIVMEKIRDLDAVAYVRFASVYREFKDVNTFMEEIRSILGH
jgi:transcriptional repressor NrdR